MHPCFSSAVSLRHLVGLRPPSKSAQFSHFVSHSFSFILSFCLTMPAVSVPAAVQNTIPEGVLAQCWCHERSEQSRSSQGWGWGWGWGWCDWWGDGSVVDGCRMQWFIPLFVSYFWCFCMKVKFNAGMIKCLSLCTRCRKYSSLPYFLRVNSRHTRYFTCAWQRSYFYRTYMRWTNAARARWYPFKSGPNSSSAQRRS